jgi:hypothetical protein
VCIEPDRTRRDVDDARRIGERGGQTVPAIDARLAPVAGDGDDVEVRRDRVLRRRRRERTGRCRIQERRQVRSPLGSRCPTHRRSRFPPWRTSSRPGDVAEREHILRAARRGRPNFRLRRRPRRRATLRSPLAEALRCEAHHPNENMPPSRPPAHGCATTSENERGMLTTPDRVAGKLGFTKDYPSSVPSPGDFRIAKTAFIRPVVET